MRDQDYEKDKLVKKNSCSLEDVRLAQHWTLKSQRHMIIIYFFGSVFLYASRTAIAVCMPDISNELGWDKHQQGLVLSCFLWGYPLTQVAGGYLADKIGGAQVIFLAGVAWSFVTLTTPVFILWSYGDSSRALALIILSRFIQGVTQGVHYPASMSLINQYVPAKERTFVYSCIGAGSHGGTLFTGLFGSIISHALGWRKVFYAIGLLSGGWLGVLYLSSAFNKQHVISMKEDLTPYSSKPVGKLPWKEILKKSPFWAMIIAHSCEGYTYFVFLFWLPTFFSDNYPDAKPWMYNVVPWVIDMAVSIMVGIAADKMMVCGFSKTYTRKFLNIFAQLMMGAALILISCVNSYEMTIFLLCLAAAGHGFYQSTVIMNPSDITPKHSGYMFGVMNTFGAIPGFLGTYISGAILQTTKSWNLMYGITGTVCVTGWGTFAYYGSGEPII